jgi:hypothetical protein
MECPVCGSANVAPSHRRGAEKWVRYAIPRAPYRCKDCWSRFWRFENPWKTPAAMVGALAAVLLLTGAIALSLRPRETPPPDSSRTTAESRGESFVLPPPAHRTPRREADPAPERPRTPADAPSASLSTEMTPTDATDRPDPSPDPASDPALRPSDPSSPPEPAPGPVSDPIADPTADPATLPEVAESRPAPRDAAEPATPATEPPGTRPDPDPPPAGDAPATPAEPPVSATAPKPASPARVADPEPAPSPETAALPPIPKGPRTLREIVPRTADGAFEMSVNAGGPVAAPKIFPLAGPPKLVIDLAGEWRREVKSPVEVSGELVRRIRIGGHTDFVRLVLDLATEEPVDHEVVAHAEGFRLRVFPKGDS